jgi:hypothetical protein
VDRINLTHDREQWRIVMTTVIGIQVPEIGRISSVAENLPSFSRRNLNLLMKLVNWSIHILLLYLLMHLHIYLFIYVYVFNHSFNCIYLFFYLTVVFKVSCFHLVPLRSLLPDELKRSLHQSNVSNAAHVLYKLRNASGL